MNHSAEVNEKLEALEAKFRTKLSTICADIDTLKSQDDLNQLLQICHKLSGSAGTFGFQTLSVDMKNLEGRLRAALTDGCSEEDFQGFCAEARLYLEKARTT